MRRLISTTIGLLALLLATVAVAPGVAAQTTADHPVVGAWMVDTTPGDATDVMELVTVAPGGILTDAGPDGTSYGAWAATGERSADATFLFPLTDPECGCLVGYGLTRASVEVAEDGQSFAGTYTIEFPSMTAGAMGVPAGQLGPGEVTGQRITVEPMGEPVGPLPAEEDPEPVATAPSPEASPTG